MSPSAWWDAAFSAQAVVSGVALTPAEMLGFVAAVAMVWCNLRVSIWGWPLAIFSSALYGALFLHTRLYGQAGLQLMFMALGAWGWWTWWKDRNALQRRGERVDDPSRGVRHLPSGQRLVLVGLTLCAWPLLGLVLDRYTDSPVPYWDAFPTVASVLGQYLLARKAVENWPTWLVVNVVSVALYAQQRLWLTVVLYAGFVAMSLWGWRTWLRLAGDTLPAGTQRLAS